MSIRKNVVFNLAGAVVPLVVGAVSVPYLLAHLGVERFGILTLIWTIIGYFSLFDLGLGRAITQQVSQLLGAGRHEEIRTVVAIGLFLTLLTGVGGAVLLAGFSGSLARSGFGVSAPHVDETSRCLLVAALGVPLATVSAGLRGALEAYNKFFVVNVAKAGFGVAVFMLPAVAIYLWGNSLLVVTVCLVAARLGLTLAYLVMIRRLPYHLHPTARIRGRDVLRIFTFGLWMGASNLVSAVLVYADRFVIAKLLGAAVVAFYTVPFEIIIRLLIVPGAIGASLLPRLSTEFSESFASAMKLLKRATRSTALIMAGLTSVSAALAYPVMSYFISPGFAMNAIAVTVLLCIGVFFNGVANIPYNALHALGAVKSTGTLHLCELIVYLPVLYLLVKSFGITGAAAAWALRTGVDCVIQFYLLGRSLERGFSVTANPANFDSRSPSDSPG